MILEQSMGIGGRVVGIGKITKEGELVYREIEPVHNTIVDGGFAIMLQANFDDTCYYDTSEAGMCYNGWISGLHTGSRYGTTYYNWRVGAIQYCQYGTGGKVTEESDTSLENPVAGYGTPYILEELNGCAYVSGTIRNRVTYRFGAASENAIIREIGLFTRKVTNGTTLSNDYKMFARVVLASPYTVMAGESFVVTYELGISLPPVAHNLDTGLVDENDVPIKYSRKYVLRTQSNYPGLPSFNWNPSIPHTGMSYYKDNVVGETGYSNENSIIAHQALMPIWSFVQTKISGAYYMQPAYSLTDKAFPNDWSNDTGVTLYATGAITLRMQPYNATTKSRSCQFVLPTTWPNNLAETGSADIHYLLFNGVAYRFGYYDEGHEGDSDYWHPQAIHKTGRQTLSYTLTQRFERM